MGAGGQIGGLGLRISVVVLLVGLLPAVAALAAQRPHCHPDGTKHAHSSFASGTPLQDEHRHYLDGFPGSPMLHNGRITIPAGWTPHDDPDWHNHGDDDVPLTRCDTTRAPPPRTTTTTTTTRSPAPQPLSRPRSNSRGAAPTATPVPYAVGVGWLQADGTEIVLDGFVRDQGLGQTYALVRRELDDQVVRYWIAPDSALALIVPWDTERVQDLPTATLRRIPLDHVYPPADMLVQLVDGRILHWDTGLTMWRHVPNKATFQVLEFRWCRVLAADAGYLARIMLGTPHPATSLPERADYGSCDQ